MLEITPAQAGYPGSICRYRGENQVSNQLTRQPIVLYLFLLLGIHSTIYEGMLVRKIHRSPLGPSIICDPNWCAHWVLNFLYDSS